jgi:nitrate reductase NapE
MQLRSPEPHPQVPTFTQLLREEPTTTRGSGDMEHDIEPPGKAQEFRAFLILSVLLAPVLAFAIVGGYGFLVWMFQLVAGPPGAKF